MITNLGDLGEIWHTKDTRQAAREVVCEAAETADLLLCLVWFGFVGSGSHKAHPDHHAPPRLTSPGSPIGLWLLCTHPHSSGVCQGKNTNRSEPNLLFETLHTHYSSPLSSLPLQSGRRMDTRMHSPIQACIQSRQTLTSLSWVARSSKWGHFVPHSPSQSWKCN